MAPKPDRRGRTNAFSMRDFFGFAAPSGCPPAPAFGMHAGIDASCFANNVKLDTEPPDDTPEEKSSEGYPVDERSRRIAFWTAVMCGAGRPSK